MRNRIRRLIVAASFAVAAAAATSTLATEDLAGAHALSMFDDVKYGPEFEHFDYADPNAPRGGELRLAALGTFDNLNSTVDAVAKALARFEAHTRYRDFKAFHFEQAIAFNQLPPLRDGASRPTSRATCPIHDSARLRVVGSGE